MALHEDSFQNLQDDPGLETINSLAKHVVAGDASKSHADVTPKSSGIRSENVQGNTGHVINSVEGSREESSVRNADGNDEEMCDEATLASKGHVSENNSNKMVQDSANEDQNEASEDQNQLASEQIMHDSNSAQLDPSDISNQSSQNSTKSDDSHFIFTCPFCFVRCKEADDLKSHLASHAEIKIVDKGNDMGREHRCSECDKAFDNVDQLELHQLMHRVKSENCELHKCSICGKSFHTKYGLANHQSVHELDKFQCGECKQYFMDEENLKKHLVEHRKQEKGEEMKDTGENNESGKEGDDSVSGLQDIPNERKNLLKSGDGYKCSVCERVFSERFRLNIHLKSHTEEKPFKCQTCPKAFAQKYKLIYHERTHSGEKPYECKKCGKSFAHMEGYRQHYNLHTGEKPYSCLHCGQKFRLRSSLRVHQAIHITTRNFKCGKCSKSFKIKRSLNRHVKRVHWNPGRHECGECGETFSTKTRLTSHEFLHKHEKEREQEDVSETKPSLDSIASFDNSASSEQDQSESVVYNRPSKKKLECKYCHRPFQKPSVLMRHERIHTGEKPYICHFCPKGFARKDGLLQHERIHTGEKPFSCRYCQASYRSMSGRKDHEKTHLKCTVCRKKFKTVPACEAHESTHNEGSMYKCETCEKSFASLRYLTYHTRIHEDNSDILECEQCGEVFGTKGGLSKHKVKIHDIETRSRVGIDESRPTRVAIRRAHVASEEHFDNNILPTASKESDNPGVSVKIEGRGNSNDDDETMQDSQSEIAPSESGDPDWMPILQCKYCPKLCENASQFDMHKREHVITTGKKPHKCGFCGMTFIKESVRITHERIHTGEKPFKCGKCPRAFARKDNLKKHEGTHNESMPYSCPECDKKFKQRSNLNAHVKYVHGYKEEGWKVCHECGKEFKTMKALTEHKLIHSESLVQTGDIRIYICQFCQESFKRLKEFSRHLRNEHGEYRMSKTDEGESAESDEMDEVDEDDEKDVDYIPEEEDDPDNISVEANINYYQCDFCVQKRTTIKGLEFHERTHTNERAYKCAKCSEEFVREEALKLHERNKCSLDERKVKAKLIRSENKREEDNRPVPCNVCGKIFENESSLRFHKKSHSKKELMCSACGDVLPTKSALKEHRRSHSIDVFRNYYCTECPKSYMQKKSLQDHMETCHQDADRKKCEHCGATFVNEGWLRKHMFTNHHEVLVVEQALKSSQTQDVDLQQGGHSEVDLHHNDSVVVEHNPDKGGDFETLHLQSTMDCIETLAAFGSLQGEAMAQVANRVSVHQDEHGMETVEVRINEDMSHVKTRIILTDGNHGADKEESHDRLGPDETGEESKVISETPTGSSQITTQTNNESSKSEKEAPVADKAKSTSSDSNVMVCQYCPRTFKKRSQLRNHERVHTGEKPYLCNQCGKGFKILSGLRAHEDRHKGLKRYKCTECPKAYANPSALQEHLDAHKGIKRYQCPECPKQFRQHQSLKEHLDVHRGFRKYQCDQCPRSFSQRRSWRMHMRTHGKIV